MTWSRLRVWLSLAQGYYIYLIAYRYKSDIWLVAFQALALIILAMLFNINRKEP